MSKGKKPAMAMGMKVNKVAYGKGAPFGSDGSGTNKPASALSNPGIKKGAPVKRGMVENSGKSSPIGNVRPTQDGGPRTGQTSGVDTKVTGSGVRGVSKHGHPSGSKFDYYKGAR